MPSNEAATLGEPSYVWRFGQDRRLQLIRSYVPIEGLRMLDVGCGIGTYVRHLQEFSSDVYGVDVSPKRLSVNAMPCLVAGVGEHLPFKSESFDLILLNEVIEHVQDDRRTIAECVRVLRVGGHVVIFAPNRLYPFETHGVQIGNRYIFGNIPLVNYLPDALRNRLVPHARAYRASEMKRLASGVHVRTVAHSYVYPGFDNIARRSATAGIILRSTLYRAEHTTLRRFGLSHFMLLQKLES
jgi:ubiquinone/menaquinone biosynthesis C-methylase UbiE